MRILLLGASGMLGNSVFTYLRHYYDIYGTVRSNKTLKKDDKIITGIDVFDKNNIQHAYEIAKPDIVINCVGIIKQLDEAKEHYQSIYINSLLPHVLASMSKDFDAKLIHFSTDCVFSGQKGSYLESDMADATDLYGRTKYLGEVAYPQALTLRTSIIGHGILPNKSLIDWFLSQENSVNGFTKAIFSGAPTVEIARILVEHVIPNIAGKSGVYHLSTAPINKFGLLTKVAEVYGKNITILAKDDFVLDRSLDSTKFRLEFEFTPKDWDTLIREMYEDYLNNYLR